MHTKTNIMTPKEKAKELVDKMIINFVDWTYFIPINKTNTNLLSEAKQRSLILVDEILSMLIGSTLHIDYWQEVKKEIELM